MVLTYPKSYLEFKEFEVQLNVENSEVALGIKVGLASTN